MYTAFLNFVVISICLCLLKTSFLLLDKNKQSFPQFIIEFEENYMNRIASL